MMRLEPAHIATSRTFEPVVSATRPTYRRGLRVRRAERTRYHRDHHGHDHDRQRKSRTRRPFEKAELVQIVAIRIHRYLPSSSNFLPTLLYVLFPDIGHGRVDEHHQTGRARGIGMEVPHSRQITS